MCIALSVLACSEQEIKDDHVNSNTVIQLKTPKGEQDEKQLQFLMRNARQRCPQEDITRCQEWTILSSQLTADLRGFVVGAVTTTVRIQQWKDEALSFLDEEASQSQSLAVEILLILCKRMKYRYFQERNRMIEHLSRSIDKGRDPLISSRLLVVLNELIPLGDGELFYRYTDPDWPDEVQSAAWRVIASRHSKLEPVQEKTLIQSMMTVKSQTIKSSLIFAAVELRTPKVIRWCGEDWWRTELFESCREALSGLASERASRSLWRWVKSLFDDMDQTLNADQKIAEGLVYLSEATQTAQAEKRYLKLLDRFFERRRAEPAAMAVAESWLKLPSKRYGLELALRYLRAKSSKIVTQSHFFEQHVRKIIYQLSTPKGEQGESLK